ncbi:MAG: riboflavin synthase [Woeseia sp.]|nr:riboflavin synthase [Woeseia sp.]
MFTGIIKAVGEVGQIARQGGDLRLTIQSPDLPWAEFDVGESISVNGVCLTAVAFVSDGFLTDVSAETLAVTTLQQVSAGSRVNLEPALALGERLGGHLVSGHVDCIGTIKAREVDARSVRIDVEVPAEYGRYIAKKGSVCIDGVSLTVNTVAANTFSVNIIPHTAEVTTVKTYEVGGLVNIEVDLLARYLERLLTADDGNGITQDFLRANGYV